MIKIQEYNNRNVLYSTPVKGKYIMYYDCNNDRGKREERSIYTDDMNTAINHATKYGYKYVIKVTFAEYEPVSDIYTDEIDRKIVWQNIFYNHK